MTSLSGLAVAAIVVTVLATLGIGVYGVRLARTTSDFYVASRVVTPGWNASAIGGEYLSAASYLGVAGLILAYGADMLWFPVGYTAGYLVLLVLVAAPLRRSGAYTLPDFAEARLESLTVRRACSVLVVLIGWLYLVPQMQGAGLTLATVAGAPSWVGSVVVAAVVAVLVLGGGMRSITFVQAFQYWLKLTALAVPILLVTVAWYGDGGPALVGVDATWALPMQRGSAEMYATYSLMVALFLGTAGLPHVLVRFYTNPDGGAARRTTLVVLALLGIFYLFPLGYGVLGHVYAADLVASGQADAVVLVLPGRVFSGTPGLLLGAIVAAGAFAAFISTSSGLVVSVAGVLSQDLLRSRQLFRGRGVAAFRAGTGLAVVVPLLLALLSRDLSVATTVGLAFAVAASSFCPLLLLGIWWRRLSDVGALSGLVVGGGLTLAAVLLTVVGGGAPFEHEWPAALIARPAAWSVPLAVLTMVVVSLRTPHRVPPGVSRTMVRLHTPEDVALDRGGWRPPASG